MFGVIDFIRRGDYKTKFLTDVGFKILNVTDLDLACVHDYRVASEFACQTFLTNAIHYALKLVACLDAFNKFVVLVTFVN